MLLLTLVEPHDGLGNLPHQITAKVRWFQIERQGDLTEQVQRGAGGEVDIEPLNKLGLSAAVNTRAAVDLPAPTSPVSRPTP